MNAHSADKPCWSLWPVVTDKRRLAGKKTTHTLRVVRSEVADASWRLTGHSRRGVEQGVWVAIEGAYRVYVTD